MKKVAKGKTDLGRDISLCTVTKEQVQEAYNDFLELNDMKTSQMTEYQKRLTELFTHRKVKDGFSTRYVHSFIIDMLNWAGCVTGTGFRTEELKGFVIYEDVEIRYTPIETDNPRFLEQAILSLHAPTYVPARSATNRPYTRIRWSGSEFYYPPYTPSATGFMTKEDEFVASPDSLPLPEYLSDASPIQRDFIYKMGELDGNQFTFKDERSVKIDETAMQPSKLEVNPAITAETFAMVVMWSHHYREAPEWVKQTLLYFDKHKDDPGISTFLEQFNFTLGDNNRAEELTPYRSSREMHSKALAFMLEMRYQGNRK